MQTFLPYPSFTESMACLDNVRLGNQVYREGLTLIRGGWPNHPASKMWRGYECSLAHYCLRGAQEMASRDYWKVEVVLRWCVYFQNEIDNYPDTGDPPWLGDNAIHASHRSNLIRKDPEYYGKYGWAEDQSLAYVWPV